MDWDCWNDPGRDEPPGAMLDARWQCSCDECGREWQCGSRISNGWLLPETDECPGCGDIDFTAMPMEEEVP